MNPAEHLTWIADAISKDLYAPFEVEKDNDYYPDLQKRFSKLKKDAESAKADEESIKIINKFTSKIMEALRKYYYGKVSSSHMIIKNLVKNCLDSGLAVTNINSTVAFLGSVDTELQLFRARTGDPKGYPAKEMLHLPYSMRSKTGNYRFSIPGLPSLYLGNSSYACWLELGLPSASEFNVSPVALDGKQRIFNLVIMNRDHHLLNDYSADKVHSWLKLLIFMVATSYRVKEKNRTFKSEYNISQSIMLACKSYGLDGIAYYSKRVEDQMFAQAAINLALFTDYKKGQEYSELCKHIKVGNSYNYFMFQRLNTVDIDYELRSTHTPFINNIGNYERQNTYRETNFCSFDKFLYSGWDKDFIKWGNALEK